MPRPVVLLVPLLLLSGCLGGVGDAPCGEKTQKTLSGEPFSHQVNGGVRENRSVWMWTLIAPRACVSQTVSVGAEVRIAEPQAADCPEGDAVVVLSTSAGPEQGVRHEGTPDDQDGEAVYDLLSSVDVRKVGHTAGVIALLEVSLPKVDDPAKARACAMERVSLVEMDTTYLLAPA